MPVPDPKYKPKVLNVKQVAQQVEPMEHEIIHEPHKRSSTGKFVNMRPNRMHHRVREIKEIAKPTRIIENF